MQSERYVNALMIQITGAEQGCVTIPAVLDPANANVLVEGNAYMTVTPSSSSCQNWVLSHVSAVNPAHAGYIILVVWGQRHPSGEI